MKPTPDGPDTTDARARRSALKKPAAAAGVVVAVLIAVSAVSAASKPSASWPTDCLVDGRTDWCSEPSAAMTGSAMLAVVHDYCKDLSSAARSDVVPQPLSTLNLAGEQVYATISGSEQEGTENAVLGTSDAVAWVTRTVGGESDGNVDVRCSSDMSMSASVRLRKDQFESAVAALGQPDAGHLNVADVANQSVAALTRSQRTEVSFGFTTCQTAGLDLHELPTSGEFSCLTEVYSQLGMSGRSLTYRLVQDPPYFKAVSADRASAHRPAGIASNGEL